VTQIGNKNKKRGSKVPFRSAESQHYKLQVRWNLDTIITNCHSNIRFVFSSKRYFFKW